VPLYEYRCIDCEGVFEVRRSMADADAEVRCPDGHTQVRRLLSVFATAGRSDSGAPVAIPAPAAGCGGHCACH
jgi:putative FmdB family regulatory protein